MIILQSEHHLSMNSTDFLHSSHPILQVLPSIPVLNPSSQFHMNNYNNYMLNSISEL